MAFLAIVVVVVVAGLLIVDAVRSRRSTPDARNGWGTANQAKVLVIALVILGLLVWAAVTMPR